LQRESDDFKTLATLYLHNNKALTMNATDFSAACGDTVCLFGRAFVRLAHGI
jgi:hypothetical protein